MEPIQVAALTEKLRPRLTAYVMRLVLNRAVAEELVQETLLRALEAGESCPRQSPDLDRWLFRIASNLAIDELRRHRSWRESAMIDGRHLAENDAEFLAFADSKRGSAEMASIAKEHLVTCFSCVLRSLPVATAAALLLREVYQFSVVDITEILSASNGQVKNWIQTGRNSLRTRYAATCKLVAKDGVCFQCVELDGYFNSSDKNPLEGLDGTLEARFAIMQDLRDRMPNEWHERLFEIFTRL